MHTQTSVSQTPSVIPANLSTQEKTKTKPMSHCVLVISLYMYIHDILYMHVLFFLVHIVLADIYSFKI